MKLLKLDVGSFQNGVILVLRGLFVNFHLLLTKLIHIDDDNIQICENGEMVKNSSETKTIVYDEIRGQNNTSQNNI